ncbi:MAG: fibronectin/fibrinogen-binding protein [Clostridiales bacterium]|nr:fibronectin/fibrinogen-binding protein [Clostridiales bacterium]
MPQDAFTLRYLCQELDKLFTGGKINRIIQPSNDEVVFTVYTGGRTQKLLLDVNPANPRIAVIERDKESPLTAPNFCMLLRKHLLSSTITGINLIGFDRIVRIDFLTSDEFKDSVKKTLYVELMGRYSNVILTEDGKILGGNRGINMFDNGVRPLIVGHPYVFPPVGDKKLPTDTALIEIFDNCDEQRLAECVTANVQGIATSTAKEIVSSFKSIYKPFGKQFFEHLNQKLYSSKFQPCVLFEGDDAKDVMVYPYATLGGDIKSFSTLYEAEEFYFAEKEKIKKYKNKKERLTAVLSSAIKKVKKRIVAISSKQKDAEDAEENRLKGELILSNIYRIKQGDKECVLDNYYDGSKVKIVLNENLSPSKNAENFYKKYNKQKRTQIALKPQREQADTELAYLVSVMDEIELAETIDELNFVQAELLSVGIIVEKQAPTKKKKEVETQFREYKVFGFTVRAGRNNAENDKLTFTAKGDDVWVHVKDHHSSHVVIEKNGKEITENVIRVAGEISAYYSKAREGGKTEIVYTEKKHVKKPPKSKPGFCIYDNFKSMVVEPKKHAEFLKCE